MLGISVASEHQGSGVGTALMQALCDYADGWGQVLRIDRLVAVNTDAGRQWWVLDYKLQHRPQALEAYRAQMSRYVAAVSALQAGEPVRAAFITGAGEWVPLE